MSHKPKLSSDSDYFKDKMLLMNAHENGAVLHEEQLLFLAGEHVTNFDKDVDDLTLNLDHVFEADHDAIRFDVMRLPPHRPYHMDVYHEVHEMQNDVQHNYVVDSDADYTSDSNIIPYDHPLCVENKVKFAPPDYSKENYLAIFAPQRDLTPEQIFWSKDKNDRKKAETSVPKPLSALTVYPLNTPVKLVPRVLLTKIQVKINLYVLTQLLWNLTKLAKRESPQQVLQKGKEVLSKLKDVNSLK
ncbi:hypothetical protein Tco_1503214 [Tanacetum coccineum]